jgi:hypothetical protein
MSFIGGTDKKKCSISLPILVWKSGWFWLLFPDRVRSTFCLCFEELPAMGNHYIHFLAFFVLVSAEMASCRLRLNQRPKGLDLSSLPRPSLRLILDETNTPAAIRIRTTGTETDPSGFI